jgi:hypothetical protein
VRPRRRPDYASDRKRVAKLVATFFELITQQFRGQRSIQEASRDKVDSHRRDLERQVSGERGECSGDCARDAHADGRASSTSATHEVAKSHRLRILSVNHVFPLTLTLHRRILAHR